MINLYKRGLKYFIILLFLIHYSFAKTTSAQEYFRSSSTFILKNLMTPPCLNNDCTRVGDLVLQSLIDNIHKVEWGINYDGVLSGSGGQRDFAINFVEARTVIVNYMILKQLRKGFISLLTLHEALGALGFKDENYELSTGLWWISELKGKEESDLLLILPRFFHLKRDTVNPIYPFAYSPVPLAVGGGGTSIGGGGGSMGIEVKVALLDTVHMQWETLVQIAPSFLKTTKAQVYNQILDLVIEENPDMSDIFNIKFLGNNNFNKNKILIPYSWNTGDIDRARIVRELFLHLGSQF